MSAEGSTSCLPLCVTNSQLRLSEPVWERAVSRLTEMDGLKMADMATNLFVTERVLLLENWTSDGARDPFYFHIDSPVLIRNLILVEDDRIFQFTKTWKTLDNLREEGVIRLKSLGSLFFPGSDGDVVLTTYKRFYDFLFTNPVSVSGLWPDVLIFCYDSHGITPEAVAVLRMLTFDSVMSKVIFSSPVDIVPLPGFIKNISYDSLALSEKQLNTDVASRIEFHYENLSEDVVTERLNQFHDGSGTRSITSLVYSRDELQAKRLSSSVSNRLPNVQCFVLTKSSDKVFFTICENKLKSLSSWILILDDSCRAYTEITADIVVDMGEAEAGTAYFGWKPLFRTLHNYEFVTSRRIFDACPSTDYNSKVYLTKIGLNNKTLPKYTSGRATELMNQLGYHYGVD